MAKIASARSFDADDSAADTGRLILRVVLGVLVLLHGISKLSGPPDFIVGMLQKADLPGALAYAVYIGEVVAPLLLILGLFARVGAAIVVVNMLVAIYLVHLPDLFHLGKQGGYALELQAMYLFSAMSLVFLGAGRFSLGGKYGRFN